MTRHSGSALGTSKHRKARVHCGRSNLFAVARYLNAEARDRAAIVRRRAVEMYESVAECFRRERRGK